MRTLAPRDYAPPAVEHPLMKWGSPVDDLLVGIEAGHGGEFRSVHDWSAEVFIDRRGGFVGPPPRLEVGEGLDPARFDDPSLIATMRLHSLALWRHDILEAADADSQELSDLVEATFMGRGDNGLSEAATAAFAQSSGYEEGVNQQLMTVDTFEMNPLWRGTALTPYVAALALSKFAHLGQDAFILHAHPMTYGDPGSRPKEYWDATQKKIAAMWRTVGFRSYDGEFHMAGSFPEYQLDDFLERAEDLWPYLRPLDQS
jgi:hypothetical protein